MKRLIIKNLKQRKTQVISMGITIVVSAMVFVCLFLLYGGMQRGVALNEERGGADVIAIPSDASAWVTDSEFLFSGAPVVSYFDKGLADEIAQIEGVSATTVQFYGQTLQESCCSTGEETRIIGFDPATDWVIMPYCSTKLTSLADDEIIIGCKVDSFKDGTAKLLGKTFRVVGTLDETGSSLDFSILLDIDEMRTIASQSTGYDHFWQDYGQPSELVSTVLIDVDEENYTAASVIRKAKKLGDISLLQRSSVISQTQKTLDVVFGIMLATGIVLAIASLLQMIARYYSSVWERKSELALYRALGASAKDLQKMICGEAFTICGLGCIIGTILGIALYVGGYAYLQSVQAFPFSALPIWAIILGIIGIFVLFALMTAISIITPLRQVLRIDPASAMQQVDIG